ncbi:hypothetical protein SLA2020_011350 [Shorea laevis]
MFCGFLVFCCKRVPAVEEVVYARYGVIEQWALLLRNAWPKVNDIWPEDSREPCGTPWQWIEDLCESSALAFQSGIVEPFYGTICLYNRERREKLSEDFYLSILPTEMQDTNKVSSEPRGLFYLDAPSASVCLLIQLEKPATEEGGVTPSVYSRKEPVHLTLRERQKLQVWSRIMPYRESFTWVIVPLFDNSIGGASGGSASPNSHLAASMSGSSSHEGVFESVAKITLDGKMGYSSGSSIVVEISNLHKVKESYTEESLQDPKRKVHKPLKGVLRLEIEKHQTFNAELENISETASMTNESMDLGDQVTDAMFIKSPNNGSDRPQSSNSKWNPNDEKNASGNGNTHGNPDLNVVVIGYAALPLSTHAQLRSEIFLLIMKELVPQYLQENETIFLF